MPRLFVAIPIPETAGTAIDRLCQGLPGTRWLEPANRHLTLRFIGEVDSHMFADIGEGLTRVNERPFEMSLQGIGHFPPRGEISSLWVGVQTSSELNILRRSVSKVLDGCGVPKDPRQFVPHVTIARFRRPPPVDRLASYLQRRSSFSARPFPVHEFVLYSSHLHAQGSDYRIEARYDFVMGAFEQF